MSDLSLQEYIPLVTKFLFKLECEALSGEWTQLGVWR